MEKTLVCLFKRSLVSTHDHVIPNSRSSADIPLDANRRQAYRGEAKVDGLGLAEMIRMFAEANVVPQNLGSPLFWISIEKIEVSKICPSQEPSRKLRTIFGSQKDRVV